MTEPRTKAGRALMARLLARTKRTPSLEGLVHSKDILAIEAEARSEGPGLDAPSLDEGLLALALYEVDGFGLLSECRETARDIASVYRRLAQEGETP